MRQSYDETALFTKLQSAFPQSGLSECELLCCKALLMVFASVEATQPYKGLLTLLKRAMALHARHTSAYEATLKRLLQEAKAKGQARLRLLASCPLAANKE
jgi:hypothetical protein